MRLAKRGRFFAWAGESQYYTEPKRLAKLGYLSARQEPGRTRLLEVHLDLVDEVEQHFAQPSPARSPQQVGTREG